MTFTNVLSSAMPASASNTLVQPFAPSAMNFVTHRDVWETPALQTLYQAMALHAKDWPLQVAGNQI